MSNQSKMFKMKINNAFKIAGRGFILSGVVQSGYIEVGDKVLVGSDDSVHVIEGISAFRKILARAEEGRSVGLLVPTLRESDIVIGGFVTNASASSEPITFRDEPVVESTPDEMEAEEQPYNNYNTAEKEAPTNIKSQVLGGFVSEMRNNVVQNRERIINAKELRELRTPCQYMEGSNVTLESIKSAINERAIKYNLPVAFENAKINHGNLLMKELLDCIVIYHPEHKKDYFNIAISIRRQGTMAFVYANDFGTSKNMKKLEAKSSAKSSVKGGWSTWMTPGSGRSGDLVHGLVGGAVGAVKGFGGSRAKQQEESAYYAAVREILNEVLD